MVMTENSLEQLKNGLAAPFRTAGMSVMLTLSHVGLLQSQCLWYRYCLPLTRQ